MVDPQILAFAKSLPKMFEAALLKDATMLWGVLLNFLKIHWLFIAVFIFIAFVAVTVKAMFGRWGSLGSFLYNFFYFGTLFVLGLIFGPCIFLNDWFNAACAIILYPICYWLVGRILLKTRILEYA